MSEKGASSITSTLTKGSCWSITINNPSEEDKTQWANAKALHLWVTDVIGQLEKGAEGTTHIQGMLKTKHVRFSQVKRAFPRAHIELAKNETALARYVTKQESRIASIESKILYATPAHIQKRLFDSLLHEYTNNDLSEKEICETTLFTLTDRDPDEVDYFRRKIDKACSFFVTELQNEDSLWARHIKKNADHYIQRAYNDLIREGYYGVEFIANNNLTHGALKKYLVSIVIRHALHSPQEHSQGPPPPSPQDATP